MPDDETRRPSPLEVARTRARRVWRVARGRLEDGRAAERAHRRPVTTHPGHHEPAAAPATPAAGEPPPAADHAVPLPVRVAAAWSWRLFVIVVAVLGLFYLLGYVESVVIPVIIAILLSALLQPGAAFLRRRGVPKSLAALIMLVLGIVVVSGVLTGVITQFISGFSELSANVAKGINQIQQWLQHGPLHITDKQAGSALKAASNWVNQNKNELTAVGLGTVTTVGEAIIDIFLILFSTFFLIRDGRVIWTFLVRALLPTAARPAVDEAGLASWRSLVAYVRATVLVAFIDAVFIGIGIVANQVPLSLALPLAALIFLGAFIPIVGATLSGTVAILVTLVTQGLIAAIIVLVIVLAVQQIEGHVLQPLIMGRAIRIHPLAVILGIAAGISIFGIVGGLIAVPLIAILNTAVHRLNDRRHHLPAGTHAPLPPDHPEPPGGDTEDTERPAATRPDGGDSPATGNA